MLTTLTIPTVIKIKPVSVLVHWSESKLFASETQYTFDSFELTAIKAALTNVAGGYDKTSITVKFEDESQYQCRLDLGGVGNELGFSDHCMQVIAYHQQLDTKAIKPSFIKDTEYIKMLNTISCYSLNDAFVLQARKHMEQATTAYKNKQEQQYRALTEFTTQAEVEFKAKEKLFQASLVIPCWANAVIIATFTEHDEKNSDPYSDYYQSIITRTIILAWSRHTRMLFPKLRKATVNHPDTYFLTDKHQSKEHRQNYSMGGGYFLTDNNYTYNGWHIQKHCFNTNSSKEQQIPQGELVAPS